MVPVRLGLIHLVSDLVPPWNQSFLPRQTLEAEELNGSMPVVFQQAVYFEEEVIDIWLWNVLQSRDTIDYIE